MFSQYTWGDFFKVVGGVAAPYYLVVGFMYYREDFRDWVAKQRGKNSETTTVTEDEIDIEEEETDSLYLVQNYAPEVTEPAAEPVADPIEKDPPIDPITEAEAEFAEVPVINDDPEIFTPVPIVGEVENQDEECLDDLIAAAAEVTIEPSGVITAKPDDQKGNVLSAAINAQKAQMGLLSGISFKR